MNVGRGLSRSVMARAVTIFAVSVTAAAVLVLLSRPAHAACEWPFIIDCLLVSDGTVEDAVDHVGDVGFGAIQDAVEYSSFAARYAQFLEVMQRQSDVPDITEGVMVNVNQQVLDLIPGSATQNTQGVNVSSTMGAGFDSLLVANSAQSQPNIGDVPFDMTLHNSRRILFDSNTEGMGSWAFYNEAPRVEERREGIGAAYRLMAVSQHVEARGRGWRRMWGLEAATAGGATYMRSVAVQPTGYREIASPSNRTFRAIIPIKGIPVGLEGSWGEVAGVMDGGRVVIDGHEMFIVSWSRPGWGCGGEGFVTANSVSVWQFPATQGWSIRFGARRWWC